MMFKNSDHICTADEKNMVEQKRMKQREYSRILGTVCEGGGTCVDRTGCMNRGLTHCPVAAGGGAGGPPEENEADGGRAGQIL